MKTHRLRSLLLLAGLSALAALPAFPETAESAQLVGKKICREAQGPDDTTSFDITLLENGKVQGEGSFSGATANFTLASGTWKEAGDAIEIVLIFSGKTYGPGGVRDGRKSIRFKVLKSDVLNAGSECFAFEGRI
jgi:hypothetical protein